MADIDGACNLYHDKTLAENNARADKLMRQLRRFAAEHREKEMDWNNYDDKKYAIQFDHGRDEFCVDVWSRVQEFGTIFFDSPTAAQLAIDTFRDELIWYFTSYLK